MAKTRVYVVRDTQSPDEQPRLVRAANPAQVRNHVSRKRFDVYVPNQDDLVRHAVVAKITIEDVGDDADE